MCLSDRHLGHRLHARPCARLGDHVVASGQCPSPGHEPRRIGHWLHVGSAGVSIGPIPVPGAESVSSARYSQPHESDRGLPANDRIRIGKSSRQRCPGRGPEAKQRIRRCPAHLRVCVPQAAQQQTDRLIGMVRVGLKAAHRAQAFLWIAGGQAGSEIRNAPQVCAPGAGARSRAGLPHGPLRHSTDRAIGVVHRAVNRLSDNHGLLAGLASAV